MELKKITRSDYEFLYEMLQQRNDDINISHRKMPTYIEHIAFWESKPYPFAAMITDNVNVGYTYVTDRNEIGIFIHNKKQGKGYGKKTIQILMQKYKGQELFANINPRNRQSKLLFSNFGFKLIQETYRLDKDR